MEIDTDWLDSAMLEMPCKLALCTNEFQFYFMLREIGIPREEAGFWITPRASATTHHIPSKDTILVCVDPNAEGSSIAIAALIVHEAVHVFQHFMSSMGEKEPSEEFMAYTIQSISQRLMWEFWRQTKGG